MTPFETLYLSFALGASSLHSAPQPDPAGTPAWALLNPAPFAYARTAVTARAALGVRLSERSELEIGAGSLGRSHQYRDLSVLGPGADTSGYDIVAREADIRARYSFPVAGRFSLYGEGGVALVKYHATQWNYAQWGWTDETRLALAPQLGVGAAYRVSERTTIRAGVLRTLAPAFSVTQATVSLEWALR